MVSPAGHGMKGYIILTSTRIPYFSPAFHPHHTSCVANGLLRIYESAKLLLPIYGALHLIPAVLFRRKALLDQPLRSALRIILGTIRSSTFIGVYVSIIICTSRFLSESTPNSTDQRSGRCPLAGHCALRNVSLLKLPEPFAGLVRSVQRSQLAWWMYCLLCGLSLFVENPHRREELAMYVLPKAGESAWVTFREVVLGIKTRRSGAWKADVAVSWHHLRMRGLRRADSIACLLVVVSGDGDGHVAVSDEPGSAFGLRS